MRNSGFAFLRIRVWGEEKTWLPSWDPSVSTALPSAVEITLEHRRFGTIRRIIVIRG